MKRDFNRLSKSTVQQQSVSIIIIVMKIYLLTASLASFTALLAVEKCTVYSVILVSVISLISPKVPGQMQPCTGICQTVVRHTGF